MSYCVNCGVELNPNAEKCPLCNTPVINPSAESTEVTEPFFPTRMQGVEPVSKRTVGVLLTAMLGSVAVCCGLLNLLIFNRNWWSLFPGGAAVMLWVWFGIPLLFPKVSVWYRLTLDTLAIGVYVLFIALAVDGLDWYFNLALPILLCCVLICPTVIWSVKTHQLSILSSLIVVLLSVGVLALAVELCCDLYLRGDWRPGWSMVVLFSCIGLCAPLLAVMRSPSLRAEARRRFHL